MTEQQTTQAPISRRSFLIRCGAGALGVAAVYAGLRSTKCSLFQREEPYKALPNFALSTIPLVDESAIDFAADEHRAKELKLHFLTTPCPRKAQDNIVLEITLDDLSKHFILIDGGYGMPMLVPDSGYPCRYRKNEEFISVLASLTTCWEHTQSYYDALGVTPGTVDVYLGTHAHTDHMNASEDIIQTYQPRVVYTPEYSDEYMEASTETYENFFGETMTGENLMDNQFNYDRAVSAAEDIGCALVTSIEADAGAPSLQSRTASPYFSIGGIKFGIINWDKDYRHPSCIQDLNDVSWGLYIEAFGKKIFLAADMGNLSGTEDILAQRLGHIDLLKAGHHAYTDANSHNFLVALAPDIFIQTSANDFALLPTLTTIQDELPNTRHYTTGEAELMQEGAVVVTLRPDEDMTTNMDGVNTFRITRRGLFAYYSGKPSTYTGFIEQDGHYYYTQDGKGLSETWVSYDDLTFYVDSQSKVQTDSIKDPKNRLRDLIQ